MSVDLVAATPNALRYLYIAPGAETDTSLTQAALIANAVAGPLKAKLQSTGAASNSGWTALANDVTLSVYITPTLSNPGTIGYGYDLVGGGLVHTLSLQALGAGKAVVEIRFHPTPDR